VFFALAAGTAFVIVPAWDALRPARPASMAIVAVYLGILMVRVDRRPHSTSTSWLLVLALTGFVLAGVLADGSVRYAQLAGIAAAAFAGCWLGVALGRRGIGVNPRSIAPIYSVLIGGMAYIGCIESEEPLWWLLLVPAIPLLAGLVLRFFTPYRASAGSAQ
jgi:hypothetical protein